jgi:predicted ester cyclase
MTTPEENIGRLRRLFEGVWNGEDPSVADELVAADYVIHDRELAERLRGPDLYRALADGSREIFPDMSFAIEDTVAAGDEVALRWTMTGTHEGSMMGEEPTGREVEMKAVEINRFADGMLAETWTQSDMLGLMEQVGAMPVGGEG